MRTLVLAHTDPVFGQRIVSMLAREGLSVTGILVGEDSAAEILEHSPDLVLIQDVPGERASIEECPVPRSGAGAVYEVRRRSGVPVIMLAEDDDEDRVVAALEAGADDYLVYPISARELATRIEVILRRIEDASTGAAHIVRAGSITVDTQRHTATISDRPLLLSVQDFLLLETLAVNSSYVLTRDQLQQAMWGAASTANDKSLTTYIRRLRLKIEADPATPRHIITVRGVGYRFVP